MSRIVFSNLHTHTQFCDGQSTMEETAQAAVDAGMCVLGFSPHGPAEYDDVAMSTSSVPDFLAEIARLRKMFAGRLKILAGMEQDALAPTGSYGALAPASSHGAPVPAGSYGLDYTIGATHFIRDAFGRFHCLDHTQEKFASAIESFGSVQATVMAYVDTYTAMLGAYWPLIAGHMDIITKLNAGNCFFNPCSEWYRKAEETLANAVLRSGAVAEVNTAGMARPGGQPYPGTNLLHRLLTLGVPVTLSSDAHHARDIVRFFPSAIDLLRDVGFSSVKIFGANGFYDQALNF